MWSYASFCPQCAGVQFVRQTYSDSVTNNNWSIIAGLLKWAVISFVPPNDIIDNIDNVSVVSLKKLKLRELSYLFKVTVAGK